jgi:hypothetical protein
MSDVVGARGRRIATVFSSFRYSSTGCMARGAGKTSGAPLTLKQASQYVRIRRVEARLILYSFIRFIYLRGC